MGYHIKFLTELDLSLTNLSVAAIGVLYDISKELYDFASFRVEKGGYVRRW
jgi:hypothetical protein